MKHRGQIFHILIEPTAHGVRFKDSDYEFADLTALIKYHCFHQAGERTEGYFWWWCLHMGKTMDREKERKKEIDRER